MLVVLLVLLFVRVSRQYIETIHHDDTSVRYIASPEGDSAIPVPHSWRPLITRPETTTNRDRCAAWLPHRPRRSRGRGAGPRRRSFVALPLGARGSRGTGDLAGVPVRCPGGRGRLGGLVLRSRRRGCALPRPVAAVGLSPLLGDRAVGLRG